MILAFVTQRYMPEYTWETTIWTQHTPGEVLDRFMLRSKNYGMVYELGADIYVIEDNAHGISTHKTGVHEMLERIHPQGIAALYEARRATSWYDVPWGNTTW